MSGRYLHPPRREMFEALDAEVIKICGALGLDPKDMAITDAELDAEIAKIFLEHLAYIAMRANDCAAILDWSLSHALVEEIEKKAAMREPSFEGTRAYRLDLHNAARARILRRRCIPELVK